MSRLSILLLKNFIQTVAGCRKQDDNRNIVHGKQKISALQIKKEELLLQNQIFPDSARDEGANAVKASEREENAEDNFAG